MPRGGKVTENKKLVSTSFIVIIKARAERDGLNLIPH